MRKGIPAVILVVYMALTLGLSAQATQVDDAKQQQKQLQSKMDTLSSQRKRASRDLLNNKQIRDQIVSSLEKKGYEKAQIEARIQEIEDAIKTLDTSIQNSQAEYDAELKLFQERFVVLYMRSRTGADLNDIAQCSDFYQLFERLHTMDVISNADQEIMANLKQKAKEIADLKAQKQSEEDNAQDQLEQSLADIKNLEVSRSQAEDRVSQSQEDLSKLNDQEDALIQEDKDLGDLIKRLQSTGAYTGGKMQWPLPGHMHISSYFGVRLHPILKVYKLHTGIDISAAKGTYIHAAASGTVIWAGWRDGGGGNTVIIDHGGGIATLYLHIMSGGILVKAGQIVSAGDVIAKVGMTGLATGPHLHFTVKVNGDDVDPLAYVSPD